MSDEARILDDLRRASIDTAVQQLRAIHELNAATLGTRPLAKAGAGDAASEHLVGLARLLLTTYNEHLRFQSRHFEYVAERTRELARLYHPEDDADVSETALTLRAAPGDVATTGFTVENLRAATAEVSFCTSEFRSEDGRRRVGAQVMVGPRAAARIRRPGSERHVEPGARRIFDVSVKVDPALFHGSDRWFADTVVVKDGRVAARLALSLEVTAAAARARARKPARGGGRGTRR